MPSESPKGLTFTRVFSEGVAVDPLWAATYRRTTAEIRDESGAVVFRQDVEVPEGWSDRAATVVASKYFYGDPAHADRLPIDGGRESSVRDLVDRVAGQTAAWGREGGYFASDRDAVVFAHELQAILLGQYASFNSPVWFNCGLHRSYGVSTPGSGYRASKAPFPPVRRLSMVEGEWSVAMVHDSYAVPQLSACFIQGVEDTMESILDLAKSEAMLFKFGSGTGTDLSPLRSTREKLSGGGQPSGPVSFLTIYDAIAGTIKSGGKTRRAAKMNTLRCDHPDILEFVRCKRREEDKARALIREGYDPSFNGEAYASIKFQNANLSVGVTDDFMARAAAERAGGPPGGNWTTRAVTDPSRTFDAGVTAAGLLREIAEGTWACGDPGVHYVDSMNQWHTCPNSGPINTSNPCSEYIFLDDSACNLASINLLRFRRADGTFDVERFRACVRVMLTAQEIFVGNVSYPTPKIALNSVRFRPLGLGYANLGAYLMASGLPYDSDGGRGLAAAITSVMHGEALLHSARMAEALGAFEGFEANREPMLAVVEMHRNHADLLYCDVPEGSEVEAIAQVGMRLHGEALELGREYGYRNAQVTLLAPTGTIAFMMDCDTTGIEPAVGLVTYKTLAGGGLLKLVDRTVPVALRALGYTPEEVDGITSDVEAHGGIGRSARLRPEHRAVFDTAFPDPTDGRSIHYLGHIRMMAAVQPFLSGAISKTVNMPREATVEEIEDAYIQGWNLGLKALAIYRDGAKESQPVSTTRGGGADGDAGAAPGGAAPAEAHAGPAGDGAGPLAPIGGAAGRTSPVRERLPRTRDSLTHKFALGGHEGYITAGLYPDGRLGEVFIQVAREGSTIGGLMDALATMVSVGLQHGVPVEAFAEKLRHQTFEPRGLVPGGGEIPAASSLVDYLAQWLALEFPGGVRRARRDAEPADSRLMRELPEDVRAGEVGGNGYLDAARAGAASAAAGTYCPRCSGEMRRTGKSCWSCPACGDSVGGCG